MAAAKFKPCYICWFFTISLAITSGTLLTDGIRAGIARFSSDNTSSSNTQKTNKPASSKNPKAESANIETANKELPTVKLSPKDEIPTVKLTPDDEQQNKDVFIKVLPEEKTQKRSVPKEDMPGYQTTLQTCNYWTKEYKKEATKQNSAYMEAACNRLKSYE